MTGWEGAAGRLGPAAEYYARLAWKVFPCFGIIHGKCGCNGTTPGETPKDYGKHPHRVLTAHGQNEATVDSGTIKEWWRRDPEANIGVHCRDSGFIVVDVDPRNGGDESWDVLESQTGGMPATVEALTGEYVDRGRVSRGRHLFYGVPDGMTFKAAPTGLRGIDIKHAGYVLIAPSRHASGLLYDWVPGKEPWLPDLSPRPITPAPEELLKLIRKGKARASGSVAEYGTFEWNGEKLDFDAILEEGIFGGERHVKLYAMACAMSNDYPVKTAHGRADVKRNFRVINATRVFPPLEEDDLDNQVERAMDFIRDNPLTEKLWPGIEEFRSVAEGIAPSSSPAVLVKSKVVAVVGEETAGVAGLSDIDSSALPRDKDAISEDNGGSPGDRSMSDAGNGRRVIDYSGSVLRFSAGMGWHVWNGEYWVPDSSQLKIREISKNLPTWIASEISKCEDADKAEALLKWATRARARMCRETAIRDAESDERIVVPISKWDSNPHMLGVKNGVIDLRTGKLYVDNRGLYITKQVQVAYSPGMTNVRWNEFLNFITGGDREMMRFLQLAAGYTLTGDRHHECMFLVYGPPGSGKSTFLDVIGTLLGTYRLSFSADVLQDTGHGAKGSQEYYMAKLMGRRMLTISELPESVNMQEDAIKRLTGDSELTGRNPGGEPFEFQAQAKLWIGTNHRPRVRDQGMWRRIRAIPFNHVPEKPDPDLKPYLLDAGGALPAALSWAVEGAMMLLGSSERLPLRAAASRVVLDATTEYQASENRIGIFLDEETEEAAGSSVNAHDLWSVYESWSEMRGEKPMTFIAFGRKLEELGESLTGRGSGQVVYNRRVNPRAVVAPAGTVPWGDLVKRSR